MSDRAEIRCGVVLNSLVVSLGHVQDDEMVTISTKFVKIRGEVTKPCEDLFTNPCVHTLNDASQSLAMA